jgi:DNA-binding LacI/PurR family transcriptional regulator
MVVADDAAQHTAQVIAVLVLEQVLPELGDVSAALHALRAVVPPQHHLELRLPPTAIIAADDLIAAVTMNTIQQRGLSVPEDVSIIGIDDQHFASVLNPALTTVQLPVPEAGRHAIEMLLRRMAGDTSPPKQLLLPCPLLTRASVASPSEMPAS